MIGAGSYSYTKVTNHFKPSEMGLGAKNPQCARPFEGIMWKFVSVCMHSVESVLGRPISGTAPEVRQERSGRAGLRP